MAWQRSKESTAEINEKRKEFNKKYSKNTDVSYLRNIARIIEAINCLPSYKQAHTSHRYCVDMTKVAADIDAHGWNKLNYITMRKGMDYIIKTIHTIQKDMKFYENIVLMKDLKPVTFNTRTVRIIELKSDEMDKEIDAIIRKYAEIPMDEDFLMKSRCFFEKNKVR